MLVKSKYKEAYAGHLNLWQWLFFSCSFSSLLALSRVVFTGSITYLSLGWNLFLAIIPFIISEWLSFNQQVINNRFKCIALVSAWLLFIPNSFYIVTDMFHLEEVDSAPKWFDLLLIFSFAWNGILFGVISIRRMELLLEKKSNRAVSVALIFFVMWLNALGIYIGRYLRYNTWDVLMQPFSLAREMLFMSIHPFRNKLEWTMIFIYAIFITLLYFTLKKLGENFNLTTNLKK